MNEAQKEGHCSFLSGYDAYARKLTFPPACNEGDYSGFFWAGFHAAELIHSKAEKLEAGYNPNGNAVLNYDDPKVTINWRYM